MRFSAPTLAKAFGFAAISFLIFSTQAESISKNDHQVLEQLKQSTMQSGLSYQLLESLTTEVGARPMGSPADKKAQDWALNNMKALGFDKVWREPVTHIQWLRGEINASITSPYPHKVNAIALGGSVGTTKQGITAQVVEFKDLAALEAAPKNSLNGKIAFVSYRMEQKNDGSGYGKAVGARVVGASTAAEKGALAFIMRSVGTDNNRLAHTGVMRYKDGIKKIPAVAISNPDADILVSSLKRDPNTQFSLSLTAKRNDKVEIQSANIIGEITGSTKPNEIVVLGAHLDSWDVGTGAMDDGLGVAITMASVANIAKLTPRPARTIRVILYAGEEIGLIGAKQYMKDHKDEVAQHSIGAEWDFGIGKIYQFNPGVGASALNAIRDFAQVIAPLGVSLSAKNDATADSDMSLLTEAGMPSVSFSPDGMHYFDYHHTENDTFDKISVDDIKQNTTVYTLFAFFAAQADVDFRK